MRHGVSMEEGVSCKMYGVLGWEAWGQGVSNLQSPPERGRSGYPTHRGRVGIRPTEPPGRGRSAGVGGMGHEGIQPTEGEADYGDPIVRENRSVFLLISGCGQIIASRDTKQASLRYHKWKIWPLSQILNV